jgi:NAD(P)-dependent dehydrogenase (short-subunit alcohol dehydrogenase family)
MGLAAALAFHRHGGELVLAGRSHDRLATARGRFDDPMRVHLSAFDMTDGDQVDAAMARLPADGIDHIVVTAASVTHGPFSDQSLAAIRAMFESKFWVAYGLARAALPHLRPGGAIVLFSGVLSRRPAANCAGLGAACAAVEALTRGLALELGPQVRVNCIAPGMVQTELHDRVPAPRREEMFQQTGTSLPVGRIGQPDEIAEAVLFAATNGYLTGHVLDIDGGHMIRQYSPARR